MAQVGRHEVANEIIELFTFHACTHVHFRFAHVASVAASRRTAIFASQGTTQAFVADLQCQRLCANTPHRACAQGRLPAQQRAAQE